MPAQSSLKGSNSHNTLKSSIVPGGFSALSLKLDTTRHCFHHNPGPQAHHRHAGATASTLHYSHTINPESDTWRFLGSMPATQRYKIHLERAIIHEVTGLNDDERPGAGDLRTRCQIPPQPLLRSWIRLRENVGLDASHAAV